MIKNYYTLDELLDTTLGTERLDPLKFMTMLEKTYAFSTGIDLELSLFDLNKSDFYELQNGEGGSVVVNKTIYSKLLRLIYSRFYDHYVMETNEDNIEIDYGDSPKELISFRKHFLGVLYSTKDKYASLLGIYENEVEHLMNPVKTTRESYHASHRAEDYDNDVSTKDIYSDVVSTEDVASDIDADQFVSNLSKGIAHTDNIGSTDENGSNTETTNDDRETTMRRIAEIQDSYQKLLYNWSEEFKNLFIEPLNV